jgi:hypothetical protein
MLPLDPGRTPLAPWRTAVYDPMETLHWMLDDARAALAEDRMPDPARAGARPRVKTKARKAEEAQRVAVLEEALWNIAGRPVPLEDFRAGRASVAA